MKLITEQIQDVQVLVENTSTGKNYFIEGIFMQSETKNRNGRIYPKHILEREVSRYNSNYVAKNRAFGELGHPDSPQINLDRVSHMITKLYPDRNDFIGKAKIIDTPYGVTVKRLLDAGANLGVSTRGVGSLKTVNGYQLVTDDFHLATAADIVADPSAPDAFVRGIMEDKEWTLKNGIWSEQQFDQAKQQLNEATRNDYEERALRMFSNYMSKLSNS